MQLLDSATTAIPQCVAMSLISNQALESSDMDSFVPDPMMISSSLATISCDCLSKAVRELIGFVSASLKASRSKDKSFAVSLFGEESLQGGLLQVFRPLSAHGVALHYRFISDDNLLKSLAAHLLAANNAGDSNLSKVPASVAGIIFCVGVSGLSSAFSSSSSIEYYLPQRIADCLTIMAKTGANDTAAVKTILSTFLLTDDELRKTNEMVSAPNLLLFQTAKTDDKAASTMGMMSPLAGTLNLKRMAGQSTGSSSQMGKGVDGGENGSNPQATGVHISLEPSGVDRARSVSEQIKVLAIAETDALLRKYSLPAQERKANLDLAAGNKSRFSRRKNTARGATRDPDFDNFDYKGPTKLPLPVDKPSPMSTTPVVSPSLVHANKEMASSIKAFVPALAAARTDVGQNRRVSISSASSAGHRNRGLRKGSTTQFVGGDDETHVSGMSDSYSRRRRSSGHAFEDDASHLSDGRSGIAPQGRLQVNIALNEDLSCSYKLSQLSTCSVEGVIQVQVKTSGRTTGPFMMVLRDPSRHIESLQENKRFADDLGRGHESDFQYAVNIQKGDTYTPVVRYKCVGGLRPVPLRVQTRVKTDGDYCRVALQISSNPNNEANLTDLTIIMGIPDEVIGESLVTQPEGGVWNASKRSVIWCVSELGNGEKFQLQARFELGDVSYDLEVEKPKFPVLIRSQCLFSQLSGVEIDVRDIPGVFPADIEMKLARRYRIAHRERS